MSAPIGAQVGIYYDGFADVEIGDIIRTPTGRCYLVDTNRIQQRGMHIGRQHLRCTVIAETDVPADAEVHPIHWYPRG